MHSPVPRPLVTDAMDWRHVLDRFLADSPASEPTICLLEKLDGNLMSFLPPICAAWSAAQYASLLNNKKIRIAILGVDYVDSGLDGRLYSLLPWLLGKPNLEIEIELIGPELETKSRAKALDKFGLPIAGIHKMTCGKLWAERKDHDFDLLFIFHPGLESHVDEWMHPNELPLILASGIPLVVFSYDLDEAERDAAILIAYGATISARPRVFPLVANSYTDIPKSPPITSVGATFTVKGFKTQPIDLELIDEIVNIARAMAKVLKIDGIFERHSNAFRPCFIFRGEKLRAVMHVFAQIYFDHERNELFIAIGGVEENERFPTVPSGKLAEKLNDAKTALDRSRLAASIYNYFTSLD